MQKISRLFELIQSQCVLADMSKDTYHPVRRDRYYNLAAKGYVKYTEEIILTKHTNENNKDQHDNPTDRVLKATDEMKQKISAAITRLFDQRKTLSEETERATFVDVPTAAHDHDNQVRQPLKRKTKPKRKRRRWNRLKFYTLTNLFKMASFKNLYPDEPTTTYQKDKTSELTVRVTTE